jgi:hypothetical protein
MFPLHSTTTQEKIDSKSVFVRIVWFLLMKTADLHLIVEQKECLLLSAVWLGKISVRCSTSIPAFTPVSWFERASRCEIIRPQAGDDIRIQSSSYP